MIKRSLLFGSEFIFCWNDQYDLKWTINVWQKNVDDLITLDIAQWNVILDFLGIFCVYYWYTHKNHTHHAQKSVGSLNLTATLKKRAKNAFGMSLLGCKMLKEFQGLQFSKDFHIWYTSENFQSFDKYCKMQKKGSHLRFESWEFAVKKLAFFFLFYTSFYQS